jgi:hypothetical protein
MKYGQPLNIYSILRVQQKLCIIKGVAKFKEGEPINEGISVQDQSIV